MTIAECYFKFGGNYEEILCRLKRDETISKLAIKFLDDQSYNNLITSLKNYDLNEAYISAHTLKGICQNLSFSSLYEVSNKMAETLRDKDLSKALSLLPSVDNYYNKTINAITEFKALNQ